MIGSPLIELDQTESTNIYSFELLTKTELQEGTVVSASKQIMGKGLGTNKWESESGKNLILSIILRPSFLSLEKQFLLNKAVSLGVFDFIKKKLVKFKADIKIKWPNDIYFRNKKISGILIENSIIGSTFKHSIIGIGININQEKFISDAPNPISVKNVINKESNLKKDLLILCKCIEKRYKQLKSNKYHTLDQDYLSALYRLNEISEFYYNDQIISASIKGVTEQGKLILENNDNQIIECDLKEVRFGNQCESRVG